MVLRAAQTECACDGGPLGSNGFEQFVAGNLTMPCRYSESPIGQLQLWCKTRFSSFSGLIQSLQRHRETLVSAVTSAPFAAAAHKAIGRTPFVEPEGELPRDLEAADAELADMEQGLFNTRAVPANLVGCKQYAVVYQNVMSPRFYEALAVCIAARAAYPVLSALSKAT